MRLLNRCSDTGPSKKKKGIFAKISSYSQVKEARLDQIDKSSTVIELLRQRPSPAFEFLETVRYSHLNRFVLLLTNILDLAALFMANR